MPKSDTATIVKDGPRPHQDLIKRIQDQAKLNADLGTSADIAFELASQAIDKIATASTDDEIFDANEASTLPGVIEAAEKGALTILEIEARPGKTEYKGGVAAYLYVSSVTDNGEAFEWTVGAPNIVASLFRFQENGRIGGSTPIRLRIKGRQATNGILYSVVRP